MQPFVGLAVLMVGTLILAFAAMVAFTIHALTKPPRRTYASALASGRPGDPSEVSAPQKTSGDSSDLWAWRSWTLTSNGVEFPVWEIDGLNPKGPTILMTHGWGDSRVGGLSRVPALARLASRLILWDMRGHGESPGRCTLGVAEAEDLRRLIERVCESGSGDVVLYGWSMGAGVSIAAAVATARSTDSRIIGAIAENPYRLALTPARNVLRRARLPHRSSLSLALWLLDRSGVAQGLTADGFDRATIAGGLGVPLLVLHGELDAICPMEDGRTIADAAKGRLVVVPGGGHHGLWTDAASARLMFEACEGFIAGLSAGRAAAPPA